ncbi:MAG: ATP-binding cassette domain-containing protein [Thermoanaerobaculia bacterium]|nr:ATP-binding cassette domain-containing protein [Thermoanaerobaculia bacterium]
MISELHNPLAGAAAVSTSALCKRYGTQIALDCLDLNVPEGAVYILVGPNGAGKTTLLRTLLDLCRADSGQAQLFGLSSTQDGPAVRSQIGYVPDSPDLSFTDYKVGELLRHHSVYFPQWDSDYAKRLTTSLEVNLDSRCSTLSKGQVRRVQLVQALAHRPALLLLDEPTDGLDPLVRDRVMGLVAEHLDTSPTTVLISTHLVHEVEGLGDHLGVLRNGRLIAQLERSELDRRLLVARGEVSDGWDLAPPFPVLSHTHRGREHAWTLWTDGQPIEDRLAATGITVRSVESLTLEGATRALLAMETSS